MPVDHILLQFSRPADRFMGQHFLYIGIIQRNHFSKHDFAVMLQLRETLKYIEDYYASDFEAAKHFTIIHRETLFDIAVRGREKQLAEQKFEFTFGRNNT